MNAETANADAGPGAGPQVPPPASARAPRRRLRPLRRLFGLLALVLTVLVLALGFVLGTQTGLRALFAAAEDLAPGVLRAEHIDGRILDRVELEGFTLELPGLSVAVGDFLLDWQPSALFALRLQVATLSARDVEITAAPSPEETPPRAQPLELPSIRLPIAVEIEQLLVERFAFRQQGAPPQSAIRLARAELSAVADADLLELRHLGATLDQPEAALQAQGRMRLDGDYPISLQLDWRFRQAPALVLTGEGRVGGDLADLDIRHRIGGSVTASLEARVRDALNAPSWDGRIDLQAVALPELVADAPAVNLQAELRTRGDLERASLTGTLHGDAPQLADMGRLAAELDLFWSEQVLRIDALRLRESPGAAAGGEAPPGAVIDLSGRLDLNPQVPAFAVDGVWERLRWPLSGEPLVQAPQGSLHAEGTLDDYRYRLEGAAFGRDIPETELVLGGSGDQQHTEIAELVVETLGGELAGKGRVGWAPSPTWDLALTAAGLDPGQQWAGLGGQIGLKADSKGGLDDGFRYALHLNAALDAYPAALINASGRGDARHAEIAELSIETLGGLIEGQGRATWAPALAWELQLDARDLDPGRHYPGLDGRIGLSAASSGGLEQGFDLTLDGDAEFADYPPARIRLAGAGTATAAELETLSVEVIGGRIDGSGELGWGPALRWDAALTLSGLDPGRIAADWPGTIGGRIASSGRITDSGPELGAEIDDLGGQLRGHPVQLAARLGMAGRTLALERLEAGSGQTRLSASGEAGETLDLRFDLRSPDLGTLVPGLQGRVRSEGRVTGTAQAPRLRLTLDGRDIERDGQGIARLDGSAEVGLGRDGPLRIRLDGRNLVTGGQRFETLSLRSDGTTAAHRVSASLRGDALRLEAALSGALGEAGAYDGSLERLDLETADFGAWGLQRAAPLRAGGGALTAGPLCLAETDSGSSACVGLEQPEAGRFRATLEAPRLAFALLDPLLPELTKLSGHLTANARFDGNGDVLDGSASLQVPEGRVEVVLPQAGDTLVFSGTRLDMRAGASGLDLTLDLPLQEMGQLGARVGLPGFRLDSGAAQRLDGQARLRVESLRPLAAFAPDLERLRGAVDGDLSLSGTLQRPDLRGRLALREAGLEVPLIGLVVEDFGLSVESVNASAARIEGGGLIGGGRLSIDGQVSGIGGAEPSLRVELSGDALKVADSSEYVALLSLDLEAGFGAGGAAVRGEVRVPEARIMPKTVGEAGAVRPSPDVMLEGEETQEGGLPLSIDVLAKLGDAVQIEAFGLRGRLRGQLRVTQQPGKELLGSGELQVIDGTYRVSLPGLGLLTSVGPPLTIKKGIVVFAKTPLDNPGLILSAEREGGDTTAGVRVLGTLRNPKLAFFSESDPDMSQAEITRYLITGIPPKRGGSSEQRSIAVGTYVAPKLFMEYENSAGESSDRVKLRYDLSDRIEVQTESGGNAQGADIFFKFEN